MFKHYFEQIDGIEVYPIFSLVLFFLIFIGICIYAYKMPRKEVDHLEHLPLED